MEHEWLVEKEVADFYRVKVKTVQEWRYTGKGPKYVKIGRLVRYKKKDVIEFMEAGGQ